MRALLLVVAMAVGFAPFTLHAQATDSARAIAARPWTVQEISDACRHRPGARMRLYGCPRSALVPADGDPLYVLDGEVLPVDTIGPGRAVREARMSALRPEDVVEVTAIGSDSATARFGPAARFGALLIHTTRFPPRRVPMAHPSPGG
jgi:hypothetical protein